MSLLDAYSGLMESVTWRVKGAVNEYNEPTYTDSTISVIWFTDERMIRTESGESLQQLAYLMTSPGTLAQRGDAIIRGGLTYPVIGMQIAPHWNGEQFRVLNLGDRMI